MTATGVFHFRAASKGGLRDFLRAQGADADRIDFYLHHGCVYADGRRVRSDCDLAAGQVVRLHTRPKQYYWEPGPLRERLALEEAEFLVLDKPAGLPVHATLDNYVDNAKYILERELGIQLFSTHRLDIPTQGLLILAKNKDAQARINSSFAKRQVQKIYHAITEQAAPIGEHALYLNPETRAPREFSFEPMKNWWECRLRIQSAWPIGENVGHRIELLTGKTHQIRAQLSALGAPILGDALYGCAKKYVHERLELECYSLSFPFRSRTLTLVRPNSITNPPPPATERRQLPQG